MAIVTKVMWEDVRNIFERGDAIYFPGMGHFRITDVTSKGVTMEHVGALSWMVYTLARMLPWVR